MAEAARRSISPKARSTPPCTVSERAGLLASRWSRTKPAGASRVYQLTAKGRRALASQRGEWREFSHAVHAVIGGDVHEPRRHRVISPRQLDRELRRRFVRRDMTILEEVRGHLTDAVEREQQRGRTVMRRTQSIAIEALREHRDRRGRLCRRPLAVVVSHIVRGRNRTRCRDRLGRLAAQLGRFRHHRRDADGRGGDAGTTRTTAPTWVWALLVGIWIPAYAIANTPSMAKLAMLAVLLFPMAGAYAGMALRRWFLPVAR